MKSKYSIIIGLILLPTTLLLVNDFFPNFSSILNIPKPLFLGLLLAGFFALHFQKDNSKMFIFWWEVVLMFYLFSLIVSFNLLGGTSQVGLSLSNPVPWVLLVISLYKIKKDYRDLKIKKSDTRIS